MDLYPEVGRARSPYRQTYFENNHVFQTKIPANLYLNLTFIHKFKERPLTWPELEQVVQDFDVFFEVQRAGQLLGVDEDSVGVAGRLLTLAEQHRAETHRQVLTRHLVHFLVGRHQL